MPGIVPGSCGLDALLAECGLSRELNDGLHDVLRFRTRDEDVRSNLDIETPEFLVAGDVLRPGGYVVVEVGYNQAGKVLSLLNEGWVGAEVRPDLAGIPRVVIARKSTSTNKRVIT